MMSRPEPQPWGVTLEVTQTYWVIVDAPTRQEAQAKAMVDAAARYPVLTEIDKADPGLEQMGRTTKAVIIERVEVDPRPKIKN